MSPFKPGLRLSRHASLQDAFQCQKPYRTHSRITYRHASTASPKPRPYKENPQSQSRPVVGTRAPAQAQSESLNVNAIPTSAPPPPRREGTIAYPYLRISIGVIFCGSMIYSMVLFSIPSPYSKLNYMHASSPRPSNSNLPPSLTKTTSQNESQA